MTAREPRDFALPPALPLDCNELRLIATWSANFSSAVHVFHYDAGDQDTDPADRLTLAPDDAAASPETVVIPARTQARISGLSTITFELPGAGGLALDARKYNATLWSESAVEKFLLPYVTMLGGSRLSERLDPVLAVWNRYPEKLKVFALLQRTAPGPGGSLAFGELLEVLYLDVEQQQVQVASLAEFLPLCAEPAPPRPRETLALPFRRGEVPLDAPDLPSERGLRRMAEYSSHFRTEPLYVLFNVNTGFYNRFFPLPDDLSGHVVVPVFTRKTREDRPQEISVVLSDENGFETALGPLQADAAFWGNGSVEHMLSPYYVSTYGRAALKELQRITDAWWGEGDTLTMLDATPEVFAVVHLPNSDWDPESVEAAPVLQDLHVVVRGAGGALRHAPLSAVWGAAVAE